MKMLYSTTNGTCLATSTDGFTWARAQLGEVEFEGSRNNSLLTNGVQGATDHQWPHCLLEIVTWRGVEEGLSKSLVHLVHRRSH